MSDFNEPFSVIEQPKLSCPKFDATPRAIEMTLLDI
jgi:hypothetical protein